MVLAETNINMVTIDKIKNLFIIRKGGRERKTLKSTIATVAKKAEKTIGLWKGSQISSEQAPKPTRAGQASPLPCIQRDKYQQ